MIIGREYLEPKTWEKAWKDKYTRELWSIPDPEVKGLLETLKNENVKKVLDVGFGLLTLRSSD